jgi:hypothetical protein
VRTCVCVCVCKNRAKLFRRALPLLFLAWAVVPGQMRGQCFFEDENSNCRSLLLDPIFYGPYEDESQDFHIKVKMYYVVSESNMWIDLPEAEARAESALHALNAAFNPHGIHFYVCNVGCNDPAFESECGKYACIIKTDLRDAHNIQNASNPCFSSEDGIDIYITNWWEGESYYFSGYAFSIPSKFLRINGRHTSGLWIDQTYYLLHEMGHCLGLLHPHENNCNCQIDCGLDPEADTCNCDPEAEPCDYQGDFICDTPHIELGTDQNDFSCGDANIPLVLRQNYMSYLDDLGCPTGFTPEQAKRMHAYLEGHPYLQPVQAKSVELPGGTLSSPSGNIVIATGTQVIDSPLEMLPGATITVRSGAALEIKAAISGACGQMWGGVVVEDGAAAKLAGTGGRIEDAACGIRVLSGGRAEALGGRLRNNTVGMAFEAGAAAGASRLLGAEIAVDDSYRGSGQPTGLRLHGGGSLPILFTAFKDERAGCPPGGRALGIYSDDGGFRCTYSSFSALEHGILASYLTLSSGSFLARFNTFADCAVGIAASAGSSYVIADNSFTAGSSLPCPPEEVAAIRLSGAAPGFRLRKNTFSQDGFSSGYAFIGTHSLGLGAGLGNAIAENTYINLQVGNRASGNNGYDGDGLRYLCNDHILNIELPEGLLARDCDIASGGSIRREQANFDDDLNPLPAGNLFSEAGYTIYNASSSRLLDYYYDAADSRQDPSLGVGSVGIEEYIVENPSEYCPAAPCPHPPCQELPQEDVFLLRRQQRDSLTAALPGISGQSEREQAEQALGRARLGMSEAASAVLLRYALDTTEVQADSLLRWLELAETYGADYRRARHHFFSGQLAAFDSVWQALPARFSLDSLEQAERQGLDELFALLRPYAPGGLAQMAALPLSAQDSLKAWAGECSEPGFLAAVLLRRNGYPLEPDCQGQPAAARRHDEPAAAPAPQGRVAAPAAGLRVFPNPSAGHLAIELPESYESAAARLYSLHGRLAFQQRLAGGLNELYLPLPPGLYILEVELPGGGRHREKIVLSR